MNDISFFFLVCCNLIFMQFILEGGEIEKPIPEPTDYPGSNYIPIYIEGKSKLKFDLCPPIINETFLV